jgi:hypothetical protein
MQNITASLIAYIAAATLLAVTPGLDTALVLRAGASEGSKHALLAALGIVCGCFAWAIAVAGGLGVVLVASQFAYSALRWVGVGDGSRRLHPPSGGNRRSGASEALREPAAQEHRGTRRNRDQEVVPPR